MEREAAAPELTRRSLRVGDQALAYTRVGSGRPVVLIHGLGCSAAIWQDLIALLRADHCVLAPDLRGSGESKRQTDERLSLELWVADLRALLLAELDGRSLPVIIGHSVGATIAVHYALRWPNDVLGLALLGASSDYEALAPHLRSRADAIRRFGIEGWISEVWEKNPPFSGRSLKSRPGIVARYRALLLDNDPDDYIATSEAIMAISAVDATALSDVRVPTMIVNGTDDDRTPLGSAVALAEALPDSKLEILDGVGHTPMYEAPDLVATSVLSFIASIAERGKPKPA